MSSNDQRYPQRTAGTTTAIRTRMRPDLAHLLRRIGLLFDEETLPELDENAVPKAEQQRLIDPNSGHYAIRCLLNQNGAWSRLSTTELVIILDQFRSFPNDGANLIATKPGADLVNTLAKCSLTVANRLYDRGRRYYAESHIDLSVNQFRASQQEFLFALSTGVLNPRECTQALGKYAVGVAFSCRWRRAPANVLRTAIELHQSSIDLGNQEPDAYAYLAELWSELYNTTRDSNHLDRAIEIATRHDLIFAKSELLLKYGLRSYEDCGQPDNRALQEAWELSDCFTPETGVEHVQRSLITTLSTAAILRNCPLKSYQARFPYGFLADLPRLAKQDKFALRELVFGALEPMREALAKSRSGPNLAANQVLFSLLKESVSRQPERSLHDVQQMIAISSASLTKENSRYSQYRHCEALLLRAQLDQDPAYTDEARDAISELVVRFPEWPLARFAHARAAELIAPGSAHDFNALTQESAWQALAESILASPELDRSELGGRSNVFAIDYAHGDLASRLIFKPAENKESAEEEARNLKTLSQTISELCLEDRFAVPKSLVIIDQEGGTALHVIERQAGDVLADLPNEESSALLMDAVELLAIYQRPTMLRDPATSPWKRIKDKLKHWAKAIFDDPVDRSDFINTMRDALPNLPQVTKRDSHARNWLVDSAGRLVAIDLEASAFWPVGHDVAQLVEDYGLLPPDAIGFDERQGLIERYVHALGLEIDKDKVWNAYQWFALMRAAGMISSTKTPKSGHRHAQHLIRYLARNENDSNVRIPAQILQAALKYREPDDTAKPVDRIHRGKSKKLSRLLRHQASTRGLAIDDEGFVDITEAAQAINLTIDEVVSVVQHPEEARFEIRGNQVRALYGHSVAVAHLRNSQLEAPMALFHGTSWASIPAIATEGLKPMSRQKVHLANDQDEALEVAMRKQCPAVLGIRVSDRLGATSVADAVWVADSVAPEDLEIRNPFTERAALSVAAIDSLMRLAEAKRLQD